MKTVTVTMQIVIETEVAEGSDLDRFERAITTAPITVLRNATREKRSITNRVIVEPGWALGV